MTPASLSVTGDLVDHAHAVTFLRDLEGPDFTVNAKRRFHVDL
jgi:hypothetical protein